MKKEALWDEFCKKNNLNKNSCQIWYTTQRTQYGRGPRNFRPGTRQWIVDDFVFLKDHIVRHTTAKSKFRKPAATATATAADDYEDEPTVHVEPLPTPGPRRARRRDTSHDAHLQRAERSRTVSASSSAAGEEQLHAALCRTDATMGSLHTMMIKRQAEELDDRASYASWLRTEMLKLSTHSFDEIQQKSVTLIMTLKNRDKSEGVWERRGRSGSSSGSGSYHTPSESFIPMQDTQDRQHYQHHQHQDHYQQPHTYTAMGPPRDQ